jgi:hypothetical protein
LTARPEQIQLAGAATILCLGLLVYLFDRSASDIYFIPEWWRFADGTPALFGSFGGYLPSFVHVYCFVLLSSALLYPWRIAPQAICLGWCAAEAIFEFGQIDAIAVRILPMLPTWFADWPILANVPGYFLYGRFDPFDLAGILLGAVLAYFTIYYSNFLGERP